VIESSLVSEELVRRAATAEDDAFLRELYASTRADLDDLGWSPEQRTAFCDFQWRAQRRGYRSAHPDARDEIVELDGVAIGRLLVDETRDPVVVVDVALVPGARGRGHGTRLLAEVQAAARERGRRVVLHVEHADRARHLYERLGFVAVADHGLHQEMMWCP
jgi:ribosomal protein S18 acetylase RimI-like enzyme